MNVRTSSASHQYPLHPGMSNALLRSKAGVRFQLQFDDLILMTVFSAAAECFSTSTSSNKQERESLVRYLVYRRILPVADDVFLQRIGAVR